MKIDRFLAIASLVFIIVATGHLIRVMMGFDLIIAGWSVPLWVNTLAFFIAGSLAFWGIRLRRKSNTPA